MITLKRPGSIGLDDCHAVRCSAESEIVLEQRAAAPYDRDRVELCDRHYRAHCQALEDRTDGT